MSVIPMAIVGIGKIARDQHIPTIAASDRFELVAGVTHHDAPGDLPVFASIGDMMAAFPEIRAVAICTPPLGRQAVVAEAFAHGLDVMIEKPPAATVREAAGFLPMAQAAGHVLHVTWHSREAAGVAPARDWLRSRRIDRVSCIWKEDVRVWHPGQAWIWEPGIGVFDPGINALSVLSHILPAPLSLLRSALRFPANRSAPIAADLDYDHLGAPVSAAFDFDQRGEQSWTITVETDAGMLLLSAGGAKLAIDGEPVAVDDEPEYARLYRRFAALIDARESDVDLTPFFHMADAFLKARHEVVEAFSEAP